MASPPSWLPVLTYLSTQAHRREIKDKETLIALTNGTSTHTHTHIKQRERERVRDRESLHLFFGSNISVHIGFSCFAPFCRDSTLADHQQRIRRSAS